MNKYYIPEIDIKTIRNHPEIIKQFANSTFNNFYLDSNSIIYDSLREKTSKFKKYVFKIGF